MATSQGDLVQRCDIRRCEGWSVQSAPASEHTPTQRCPPLGLHWLGQNCSTRSSGRMLFPWLWQTFADGSATACPDAALVRGPHDSHHKIKQLGPSSKTSDPTSLAHKASALKDEFTKIACWHHWCWRSRPSLPSSCSDVT